MHDDDPLFVFRSDNLPAPEFLIGNCLTVLKTLPDRSIDCCVCSPPYFGLRDYQTGTWEGGDGNCTHDIGKGSNVRQTKHPNADNYPVSAHRGGNSRVCSLCGARRIDEQIGMEESPEQYVDTLVAVFEEVRRVLKDHGSLWLNIGDSYVANGGSHVDRLDNQVGVGAKRAHLAGASGRRFRLPENSVTLKPKDLIGIPWRLAFALQNQGWYLRSDIIWEKPNCMPESVRDRPVSAHEHVFLLTKRSKYYYDSFAIREPVSSNSATSARNHRADKGLVGAAGLYDSTFGQSGNGGFDRSTVETRNARNVWTINTKPFPDAHFATFPPELVRRCILAGTSEKGCCPTCGAAWCRQDGSWTPACGCPEHEPVPSVVLDPFGGAGTTGMVAQRLGRKSILIELNPQYVDLARDRIERDKSKM